MKRAITFILTNLLLIAFSNGVITARGYHPSTGKTRSTNKYYSPYKSPTYDIGGTKYKYGETYKTSGLPKVERSSSAKRRFLKSQGFNKEPEGYEVDHIIPLSKGGPDKPSNMELLPKEVHKQKTASERKR